MSTANLRIACYLILGLCGLYLIRTLGTPTRESEVTNHNTALLKLGARFRAQQDSFRETQEAYQRQGFQFRALQVRAASQAASASARLDSARTAGDSLALFPNLVATLRTAGASCDSAYVADSLALASCAERASLLAIRLDTLEHALGRQIQVSQCKVLFVRCPTRRQAFAGGLLLGGGLVWALGR